MRIPAARHHGERGECTYFDDNEQRTIFVALPVILPFFQIRLENNSDYVTISWIIDIYYIRLFLKVKNRGVQANADILLRYEKF